jgi:hypothetical protein
MKETLLKLQTETIYAMLTGAMRLPGPALAHIIRATHGVARFAADSDLDENLMMLTELADYFSSGAPEAEHIRAMILKARPSQLKSIIRGYLVNYVYDW